MSQTTTEEPKFVSTEYLVGIIVTGVIIILLCIIVVWKTRKRNESNKDVNTITKVETKSLENIGNSLQLNSKNKIDMKNDHLIAKEWQENQIDIQHVITHGQVLDSQNDGNQTKKMYFKNDGNNVKNDQLIAIQMSKNQNEIHQFTQGKKKKDDWLTYGEEGENKMIPARIMILEKEFM